MASWSFSVMWTSLLTPGRYRSHSPGTVLTVTLRGGGVMKRSRHRGVIGFLVSGVVAVLPAEAQTPPAPVRIGIIEFSSADLRQSAHEALRAALQLQGYVEGKNLVFERRYARLRGRHQSQDRPRTQPHHPAVTAAASRLLRADHVIE